MRKPWFKTPATGLRALRPSWMEGLTVSSTTYQVEAELTRRGALPGKATGTILVNIEEGRTKGSRWLLCGDLGLTKVNGSRLGSKKSIEVSIDTTNLADWAFPTEGAPREPSNLSIWPRGPR